MLQKCNLMQSKRITFSLAVGKVVWRAHPSFSTQGNVDILTTYALCFLYKHYVKLGEGR